MTRADWQRQTYHFGHLHKDRYSVLLVDNLGVGASDKPFCPTGYTPSGLARDLLEVADHVQWTTPRSLHVGGGSLGGMIAQAVAREAPERIARLALWSTCPRYVRTGSWPEHLRRLWAVVAPKTFEAEIQDVARGCFPEAWLAAAPPPADGGIVVDDDDNQVDAVEDESSGYEGEEEANDNSCGGAVLRFGTNYELWAAGEIAKYRAGHVTRTGHWMQALAGARHALDAEQLRSLGDEVGRERILVLHGDADGMIPVALGRVLMAELRPARSIVVEGMGHAPIQERADWFNDVLGEWFTDQERPSSTSGR